MKLRGYQEDIIGKVRASFARRNKRVLLVSPTGSGKCYGKGTPILMFDGAIKAVEDIVVGDLLMGPDSQPRRVESLARGREEMFRITPVKGDPFECNRSHILCLRGCEYEIVNIEVGDYLQRAQDWRDRHYGWRVPGILTGDLRPELTGFSVESLGEGDYYGFVLSGPDRMHLLGDFTVGHNTVIFSYVAAGTAKNNKRVLIIAHRRELLNQISKALKAAGVRHSVLAAGYRGIPTTPVVVASVFTLAKRLKHWPEPALIVGDECHHFTPDSTWGQVVKHFPKAFLLGVTATPERLDGKGLGLMFDDMVLGPTVAELTAQGFLSPADVYAPSTPDLSGLHKRAGDFVTNELEGAMDKPSITGSAVSHYTKLAAGKRACVFCVSVKHAKDVAEEFRRAGYNAHHVDGSMDITERDKVIADFEKGVVQVLTSCDLISEGFDIPAIEVAILLRPTQSLALYLQQVGRAIRIHPDKTSTIILDHAGNTTRHGFIDEHREWELTNGTTQRKKQGEAVPSARTCPECYAVHRPAPVCPKCGHVYQIQSRKIEQRDGDLVQVSRSHEAQEAAREADLTRRFNVLMAVGRNRRYKHPDQWAFNVICGQESARLAKQRDAVHHRLVNGLTEAERERIWKMTMGTLRSAAA